MPARCSEILIGNVGGVFGDVADQGSHRLTKSGVIECATPLPSRRFAPLQREDQTGELWDVENGEAELTLDIGESSLDFYFVRPALLER